MNCVLRYCKGAPLCSAGGDKLQVYGHVMLQVSIGSCTHGGTFTMCAFALGRLGAIVYPASSGYLVLALRSHECGGKQQQAVATR